MRWSSESSEQRVSSGPARSLFSSSVLRVLFAGLAVIVLVSVVDERGLERESVWPDAPITSKVQHILPSDPASPLRPRDQPVSHPNIIQPNKQALPKAGIASCECEYQGDGPRVDLMLTRSSFARRIVHAKQVDDRIVVEGDIILAYRPTLDEIQRRPDMFPDGLVLKNPECLWKDSTVPYEIEPKFPNPKRIDDAIAMWERDTNIRFVRHDGQVDFVVFANRQECYSVLGRRGGRQVIEVAIDAPGGKIAHEIGHAIGLCHEQNRDGRDQFVRILHDNIEPGRDSEFDPQINEANNFGQYDYKSIMHYESDAWGIRKNGKRRRTIDSFGNPIGQREGLSKGDVDATRTLYPDPPINQRR